MIKKLIFYVEIFIVTVFILLLLLILTAKIPRERIVESLRRTTNQLSITNQDGEIIELMKGKPYTTTHIYADMILLNIIYSVNSEKPLDSIMECSYYSVDNGKEILYDFNQIIEEDKQANTQYMRYWHGSMSIIRPLLVYFDLDGIYKINAIVLTISALALLVLLLKTKIKELVIAYVLGLIMCSVAVVPFCLEYYWTFLIMFIVSILSIVWNKKGKNLNALFLITGMVTCYLDFLSTEIITGLIPIILILTIRYKQNKISNLKEGLQFCVASMLFWGVGYVGMWLAKWLIASIVLQVNAWEYVKTDMQYRINGTGYEHITNRLQNISNLPQRAILSNIRLLFPYEIVRKLELGKIIIICIFVMEAMLIRKREWRKLWFSALLLMIATIPYFRYSILPSHSYTHCFFTFRSQMISIMAIFLAIIYSIDKEKIKKEVKIRKE